MADSFRAAKSPVRVNPGLGSGHSNRTNTGGPSASFGIWHGRLDQVLATAAVHNLRITGLHSHIGSGSDPGSLAALCPADSRRGR